MLVIFAMILKASLFRLLYIFYYNITTTVHVCIHTYITYIIDYILFTYSM